MLEHIALYQKGLDDGCETIVEGFDLAALDLYLHGLCKPEALSKACGDVIHGSR